jgi:hypothetical protein
LHESGKKERKQKQQQDQQGSATFVQRTQPINHSEKEIHNKIIEYNK